MSIVYRSEVNTIHRADARKVAAEQKPGSFSLSVLDGAYGLGKSKVWDGVKVRDLPEWYAPHLDDVDRLCAASASLYVWNTTEGWATLHPAIVARGWVFRSLVTWDKGVGYMAGKCDVNGLRTWYDVTEVCGFYQREAWAPSTCAGQEIAYAAGADDRNWIRPWLGAEWTESGLRRRDADLALGTNGMAGHYFGASQWSLPTWEAYQQLAAYDHLRASYDHLRAEYEASRPAFKAPLGVSNVWTHGQVGGPERLRGEDGATLHPCQKPLTFADRIIRASSRPGERVWVPFGGTCREAVAAEWMARAEPNEARQVVTCEIDQDGRDYLGAVVRQLRGEDVRKKDPRQGLLFEGNR